MPRPVPARVTCRSIPRWSGAAASGCSGGGHPLPPPTALTGLASSQPLGRVGARRAPPVLLLLLVARSFLRLCCWSKLGAKFREM